MVFCAFSVGISSNYSKQDQCPVFKLKRDRNPDSVKRDDLKKAKSEVQILYYLTNYDISLLLTIVLRLGRFSRPVWEETWCLNIT